MQTKNVSESRAKDSDNNTREIVDGRRCGGDLSVISYQITKRFGRVTCSSNSSPMEKESFRSLWCLETSVETRRVSKELVDHVRLSRQHLVDHQSKDSHLSSPIIQSAIPLSIFP